MTQEQSNQIKHTRGPWRAVYNEHTKEITIYGYDGDDPYDVSEKQLEDGAVHCRIVAILPYFNDYGLKGDLDLITSAWNKEG